MKNQRGYTDVAANRLTVIGSLLYSAAIAVEIISSHGISKPPLAEHVLTNAGYTNIRVGDSSWFACGGDWYNNTFTAVSPGNTLVSGNVCTGMFFKLSTIRFNE